MPPLFPFNKVVRVTLRYFNNADTGTIINRLYFDYTSAAGTAADMVAYATAISGYWGTHCAGLMASSAGLKEVECVDLTSDSAPIGSYTSTVDGSRSGTDNSAQVAVLVTMGITRRYRGGKPKTFLPFGVATDLLNVGNWDSTFLGEVTTGWNAFIAAVLADTSYATMGVQVNCSYYGPPNLPIINPVTGRYRTVSTLRSQPASIPGIIPPDPIIDYSYESQVATQRRRTGRKR